MIVQITRKTWRIVGIILVISAAGFIYLFPQILDPFFSGREVEEISEKVITDPIMDEEKAEEETSEPEEDVLYAVHVSGAVQDPDRVWFLPEGSRVSDAIQAAGGALDTADVSRLNLAQMLTDGMKVYVPLQGEKDKEEQLWIEEPDTQTTGEERININTAGKEELMKLPGVGAAYAERIVQYRTENGPFASIEEITNVKGIGEKTFEKFKDRICI